ncbi:MAG: hypothetical protein HQK60_06890 [Deltaproteobacteria bacterium]|nr:hypothetical protein [Deltaproteobacteria bacterium]
MKTTTRQMVAMSASADPSFLPLATSFVHLAALGMKLGEREAMGLQLATEEIFAYLGQVSPGQTIDIQCFNGGYYIEAVFRFSSEQFNMRAFNLTASVCLDDECSLDEMGLLIASRQVDRFQFTEAPGHQVQLTLIKNKAYPPIGAEPVPPSRPLTTFTIREPQDEELKLLVQLANRDYPVQVIPRFFKYPGRVVDMVAIGEVSVLLAVGPDDHLGGGLVWRLMGPKTVECYGPFLFNQGSASPLAAALLDAGLGAIGRTNALGLFVSRPTAELPKHYFEPLGSLTSFHKDGSATSQTAYFRLLHEDPGAAVWAHPGLEGFLRQEYQRLFFPREIRLVTHQGEMTNPFSVLSADFDRFRGLVTLYPVRSGADAADNLAQYLRLFRGEAIEDIFFLMDLAQPWQADFTPALLQCGFAPRLILPYAGEGDVVMFQWGDVTE